MYKVSTKHVSAAELYFKKHYKFIFSHCFKSENNAHIQKKKNF